MRRAADPKARQCARVDSNHYGEISPQGPQPDRGGVDGFRGVQIVQFARFSGPAGRIRQGGCCHGVATDRGASAVDTSSMPHNDRGPIAGCERRELRRQTCAMDEARPRGPLEAGLPHSPAKQACRGQSRRLLLIVLSDSVGSGSPYARNAAGARALTLGARPGSDACSRGRLKFVLEDDLGNSCRELLARELLSSRHAALEACRG
jgi:hypothetical protein